MTVPLQGWHLNDDGSPRANKTVYYKAASDAEPNPNPVQPGTTATNVSGRWHIDAPDGEWDVYLVDGPTMRIWKARTSPPMGFGNAQIAAAANIDLTKLGAGTLNDAIVADNVATNLQERLQDMVSQIRAMMGTPGGHWYEATPHTLAQAASHGAGYQGVHGLAGNVAALGLITGVAGNHFKVGTATTPLTVGGTPPDPFWSEVNVVFPVAFPTVCLGVWITPVSALAFGYCGGVSSSQFVGGLASSAAPNVTNKQFSWLALGY